MLELFKENEKLYKINNSHYRQAWDEVTDITVFFKSTLSYWLCYVQQQGTKKTFLASHLMGQKNGKNKTILKKKNFTYDYRE